MTLGGKKMKALKIILSTLWILFCIIGIAGEYGEYGDSDWLLSINILIFPFVIYFLIKVILWATKTEKAKLEKNRYINNQTRGYNPINRQLTNIHNSRRMAQNNTLSEQRNNEALPVKKTTHSYQQPAGNSAISSIKRNKPKEYEPTKASIVMIEKFLNNEFVQEREPGTFEWEITVSFGKSTSINYDKAIFLAKKSRRYEELFENGNITHTATYSDSRDDFLDFIILYDLIANWKSTFFIINGEIIDKKTVSNIKYCYGNKCRSAEPNFCFGESHFDTNPFGCQQLHVSTFNNPWWGYYKRENNQFIFERQKLLDRIEMTKLSYRHCPAFNIEYMKLVAISFPFAITEEQHREILFRVSDPFL